MKRAFQFAAAVLALFLAVQPVLADATCEMAGAAAMASCPMGMSTMGPDCSMAQQITDAACAQNCCNHALPQMAVISAVPAKNKSGVPAQLIATAVGPLRVHAVATAAYTTASYSSPPPLYLLNRVFRI